MTSRPRIRRRAPVAGLAAILAAAPAALGQGKPVLLRMGGSPNSAHTYKVDLQQSLQLPEQFGGQNEYHAAMTLERKLDRTKGDTLYFTITVKEASATSSQRGGEPTPADLSGLENAQFKQVVTNRGEKVDFVAPDSLDQTAAQFAQSLSEFGVLPLPEKAIAVGDTWSDTIRREGGMGLPASGTMVTSRAFKVTKIGKVGKATIVDLEASDQFHFEPDSTQAQPSVVLQGTRVTNIRFDATNQILVGNASSSDYNAKLSGGGLPSEVSLYGTTKSTAALADAQ